MPNACLKQPMLTLVVNIFISLQFEDIRSFFNWILEREKKRELHCGGKCPCLTNIPLIFLPVTFELIFIEFVTE